MSKDFEVPNENKIAENVVGYAALFFSLVYRLPQLLKIHKEKTGSAISTKMLIIQNISYIFYITYGVMVGDFIYLFSSIISFVQGILMHSMILYYNRINESVLPS